MHKAYLIIELVSDPKCDEFLSEVVGVTEDELIANVTKDHKENLYGVTIHLDKPVFQHDSLLWDKYLCRLIPPQTEPDLLSRHLQIFKPSKLKIE